MQCSASLQGNCFFELHKTACPGYSGVRTLCEPPLKLASLRIINKRKFCPNSVSPINVQKIFKSGMAYFYEFDIDTCETSRTICAVFTRFNRHQIERFARHICCLNKSIGKA